MIACCVGMSRRGAREVSGQCTHRPLPGLVQQSPSVSHCGRQGRYACAQTVCRHHTQTCTHWRATLKAYQDKRACLQGGAACASSMHLHHCHVAVLSAACTDFPADWLCCRLFGQSEQAMLLAQAMNLIMKVHLGLRGTLRPCRAQSAASSVKPALATWSDGCWLKPLGCITLLDRLRAGHPYQLRTHFSVA